MFVLGKFRFFADAVPIKIQNKCDVDGYITNVMFKDV